MEHKCSGIGLTENGGIFTAAFLPIKRPRHFIKCCIPAGNTQLRAVVLRYDFLKDGTGKLDGIVKTDFDATGKLDGIVKTDFDGIGILDGRVKTDFDGIGKLDGIVKTGFDGTGKLDGIVKTGFDGTGKLDGRIKTGFDAMSEFRNTVIIGFDVIKNKSCRSNPVKQKSIKQHPFYPLHLFMPNQPLSLHLQKS
jgi:hypothetical protein